MQKREVSVGHEHGLHLLHPLLGTAVAVKGSEFTQKYKSPPVLMLCL